MTITHDTVNKLQGIASRLTRDPELRKDIVQEMLVYFAATATINSKKPLEWQLRGCEFRARNYLRAGKSIDSQKRANCGLHPTEFEYLPQDIQDNFEHPDAFDLSQEVTTKDLISQLMESITERDRNIFTMLLDGYGVRAIARQLDIDHHTVIRHRKKIAFTAKQLLHEQ